MATTYKVHPAIGIARVGNSPDEFFVGPERVHERPEPPGGFKDPQCRVKRQAARFRVFAHHDDGTSAEVTDAEAEITWTVHLANSKAAFPGRGNAGGDLTIDPGARTATGPGQRHLFDTGSIRFAGEATVTVPLGEIRTDDDGRLLVLGGAGTSASPGDDGIVSFWANAGWYDDVSDGPVTATITLRGDGSTPDVAPAWVLVAPPKFAPHQDSPTTLYDRLLERMVELTLLPAPTTTSYTADVHPVLQRARDMRWVEAIVGAHAWTEPVTDPPTVTAILNRISPPGGASSDMPRLNGSDAALTPTQYAHLQRWAAGTYVDDWTGEPEAEPSVTPDGLDRAALEAAVGGAFFPGIEAGGLAPGQRPILEAAYAEPFRLDHTSLAPGDITASLALPWQADFSACKDLWWPVPRPNDVFPAGATTSVRWERGAADWDTLVDLWHTLGFVVTQGAEKVEIDRCDQSSIALLTPALDFGAVPQGPMGMVREVPLAITFEVVSPGTAVTLEYAPGGAPTHPQLLAVTPQVTVGPTAGSSVATARLWVLYRTDTVGSALPTQVLTLRNAAVPTQTWTVTVDALTVPRRTTATALVLDRSGSMAEDRGDGQTKHVALQQAANVFVDLMLAGDGVSVVRYDHDAQALQPVLELGAGGLGDLNRTATHDVIDGNGLDPRGSTSIGDGIFEGRAQLQAVLGSYDGQALVVLTDGVENTPRWIADVAAQVDQTTYAVGLGTPQNTSAAALQALSGNTGGFLLITGAITGNNRFLLQKHFLQILAGVSSAEVVLDPDGALRRGELHRIPFTVSDADSGLEVVLLTERPDLVDFRVQTPNGFLLEPWRARTEPTMQFELGQGLGFYRFTLPTQLLTGRFDQGGTWHVLLQLGQPRFEPSDEQDGVRDGADWSIVRGRRRRPRPDAPRRNSLHELERAHLVALESVTGAGAAVFPASSGREPRLLAASAAARGSALPYSLVVHAYSDVHLGVEVGQSGFEPGATVALTATVTQSGLPAEPDTAVWAELARPDGSTSHLDLGQTEGSRFEATLVATSPGIYRARVRARGTTRRGLPWERERTVTAGVWRGGDRDPDRGDDLGTILSERDARLCELVMCVLDGADEGRLSERLSEYGLDLGRVRECLHRWCERRDDPTARR